MDVMTLRRRIMLNATGAQGLKYKIITAGQGLTTGLTVVDFIKSELPNAYHYAMAFIQTHETTPDNLFLCCAIIPGNTDVIGARYRQSAINIRSALYDGSISLVVPEGSSIILVWSDGAVSDNAPGTFAWDYDTISGAETTNTSGLKDALVNIGPWDLILTILDYNYSASIPGSSRKFCASVFKDSTSPTAYITRTNNGAYQTITTISTNYDCNVSTSDKLVSFYLTTMPA